jgi:putative DNA primase/helicase
LKHIGSAIAGYSFDNDFESKVINKSIYELPLKGGRIINLKTLEVRDRVRTDYFSFELNVEYKGRDCNFESVLTFFKSITCDSKDLIEYHRRLWGYMMTGSISDRSLHIMWGNGCNGKSSIVNIFKAIMGDFGVSLDEDTMMKKSSGGAKPELMDLLYSRCGFLPESEKKEKINSKRVKTITGDDEISARHLYGHQIKFRTQCKPIFPTNFKPEIDIDDKAILDRLKLIPFLGRFEKTQANTDYIKDLQENKLNEFFTWFCIGAFDWINGSQLIPCSEMNSAMDDYIKENNPIIDFLDDVFDLIKKEEYDKLPSSDKKQWRFSKSKIFQEYGNWKEINGEKSLGRVEFTRMLEKRIDELRIAEGRFYLCKLKEDTFQTSSGCPPM